MERESTILKNNTASEYETIVLPFVIDAMQEGAHKKTPESLSDDQWNRQKNVGGIYIGSPAINKDLKKLAGLYSVPPELRRVVTEVREVTTERIRQINKAFLRNLWNNGSPELQERHPLNKVLAVRKPLSQRSKERHSAVRGGKSLEIKKQVESGVTNVDEISANTGISRIRIMSRRKLLKGWGINIDIPRERSSYKESLEQLVEQLEKETDDKKIQELLDRLPYLVIWRDMTKKKGASHFYSLLTVVREAGFYPQNADVHSFATSLKTAGVPITRKDRVIAGIKPHTLRYYILLSRHKDRIIQALKDDQDLQRFQRNPVRLICGATKDNLPTTTKLEQKQGYEVVCQVLKELGLIIGGSRSKIRYSDIFTPDCPVPIYLYYKNYYYPVTQEEALRSFIAKKLNLS